MGLGRDLGAALTFGLSATTKQKEAEAKHENRLKLHRQRLNSFNEVQRQTQAGLEAMDAHFAAAQEVLLATGALTTDVDNKVVYGWYVPEEDVGDIENNPDYVRSGIGAIPAFGLGIGTPATIWTLVGIYGTAATGAAIGALSGAAAGAATAAWIGRAATLGLGGGMTVGRFALGPIGVAASLLTLPIGAAVAGNRERNYIQHAQSAAGKMSHYEGILDRCRYKMLPLQPRMAVTTANMQRHTGQLETATPDTPEAQEIARKLDQDMRNAAAIKNELVDIIEELNSSLQSAGFAESA